MTQTWAWDDLAEDMQVILSDFLDATEAPAVLVAHRLALSRLPQVRLDDEDAPLTAAQAADPRCGLDRGVAYAHAIDPERVAPIVIAGGRWLDGRHRVFAARARGQTHIWAFDLTGQVAPAFTQGGLGALLPAPAPTQPRRSRSPR
jgi:hypothetical protein